MMSDSERNKRMGLNERVNILMVYSEFEKNAGENTEKEYRNLREEVDRLRKKWRK